MSLAESSIYHHTFLNNDYRHLAAGVVRADAIDDDVARSEMSSGAAEEAIR